MTTRRWAIAATIMACVGVGAAMAGTAGAQAQKPLTAAEKTQKLGQWRVALDCATFHYNRMERFEAQANKKAMAAAEELWLDWDDMAMEIAEELKLTSTEEIDGMNKAEAAHKRQIPKGWPGYEKAWMGKCGKSPY